MKNTKILAVILARGGSKRLPGKNIKKLVGRSLIERAVTTAVASAYFCSVIVSTDDDKIADEARLYGASVPFVRPPELSSDTATSVDALVHAVKYQISLNANIVFDTVCLIQPTSPFLTTCHIQEAINQFATNSFTSLSSMEKVKTPPEWLFTIDNQLLKASADCPKLIENQASSFKQRYAENGAMYLVKTGWLLENNSLYDVENHSAYIMSNDTSIDIDTLDDWKLAEFMIKNKTS